MALSALRSERTAHSSATTARIVAPAAVKLHSAPDLTWPWARGVWLLVLLGTYAVPSQGQVAVRGLVRDATTLQPLPAVHIILEGQAQGTITNKGGQFEIVLPSLPAALLVRHLGHETFRVVIGPNDAREIVVDLVRTVYELDAVIVVGDLFAENLMRKVLERKRQRRRHLRNWQAQGYSRITLTRKDAVVLVSEHVFDAYRDAARGAREVIRSRRETAGFYEQMGIDIIPADFSEDYVPIQGLSFIGPTHADALKHYHFSFAGTRKYAGQTVYDLYIAPKEGLQAAFVGNIAILDSVYALVEVDLRPARHVTFAPEITRWSVAYRQQFAAVDSFWLPLGLHAEGSIHIVPKASRVGPAGFRQVALFKGHAANQPLPAAPYEQATQVVVDEPSVFADDLFLMGRDIIALMPAETVALDALTLQRLTLREALPPVGVAQAPRVAASLSEQPQFVWPLIWGVEPWVQFNRVDGYLAGAGYAVDRGRWSAGGRLAKSTGDNGTRFAARYSRHVGNRLKTMWAVGREIAPQRPSRIYSLALNSAASHAGSGDYFDYYWKWWSRARASVSFPKVRIGAGLRAESHLSSEQSVQRAWPLNNSFRSNPPVTEGYWWIAELSVHTGDPWQPFRMGPTHHAEARLEYALTADAPSYGRYEVWLDSHLKTLLRRRPRPMILAIRSMAIRTSGALPAQGLVVIEGTMGPVAALGVLRSLRSARLVGHHAAGFFWEHDFRTVLWEVLRLRPLYERQTGVTLGGGHARTWPGTIHHEVSLSVTEVFGSPFRVDVTRRLDHPGWHVSIGLSRMF